jgi:hypothetical protein
MPRKTRVPQTGEEITLRMDIEPPYTNRWGTKPEPYTIRCHGATREGRQCRAAAEFGFDMCRLHGDNVTDVERVEVHPDHYELLKVAKRSINRFEFALTAKERQGGPELLSSFERRSIDVEYTTSKRLLLNLIAELCNIISRDDKP